MERQLEDCRALAREKSLVVVAEVVDNDTSAYSKKPRPGWQQVIGLIRSGEVEGVVAWHPDRMYRRTRDLDDLVDLVDRHGTQVHTVRAGQVDLTTPTGKLVAKALGAIAEYESDHKAERIARAHLAKAERGEWKGGRRPWGYEPDGVTINEVEAAAIREAAQMILNGESMAAACRRITELTGREIARTSLRGVLLQPRIAGFRQHWKQTQRARFEEARRESRDTRMGIPWQDIPYKKAVWDGVLDVATWTDVRAILLDEARRGGKKRPRKSMLAGMLLCGKCLRDPALGTDRPVLGYGAKSYSCHRCGNVAINVAAVERLIVEKVEERLQELDAELPPVRGLESADVAASRMSKREELEERLRVLVKLFAQGGAASSALQEGIGDIEAQLASLTVHEQEAHRRSVEARNARSVIDSWETASPLEKGAVIAAMAEFFVVEQLGARTGRQFIPGRVWVKWRGEEGRRRLGADPEEVLEQRARTQRRAATGTVRGKRVPRV